MNLQLTVVSGPDKGRTFPVHEGPDLMLGRGATAYYQVTDPKVARNHCLVLRKGDEVSLLCDTSDGLFVNGIKATQKTLTLGDLIKVGDTQLRFETDEPPEVEVAEDDEPLEALSGHMLSHYAVGPVLGRGHFGLVFGAVDTKNKQAVALKVLRPELSEDDEEIACFVKAMKAQLPLRHPNLVSLHAAGKTGKYCWMALEHIDGLNMDQVIRLLGIAGPLDWAFAHRVGIHVARALDFAHGHKLLHHNVTPSNILLDIPTRTAKLNNLLLAQALEAAPQRPTQPPDETSEDVCFLAPEQTSADGKVDARTDLYGLGATLYALVTGRSPCGGKTLDDKLGSIRGETPEPPASFQPGLPPKFEKVILKLLAKKPAERHASAKELLADLEKVAKAPS